MSLFLFLLNPILGFISAMKDLNRRSSGLVYVLFFALFGYAISFRLDSADSYRIGAQFFYNDYDRFTLWQMFKTGEITDIYLLMLFAILKPITSNPKILFGILGTVMGVFSYLSVKQIYQIWDRNKNYLFYIVVFCYFLAISFVNVNGIRFWTATSIFSYFIIQFFYFKKRSALIGVLFAPMVHFGYLIPIIGLVIFFILKLITRNSTTVFFAIMVICFSVSIFLPQTYVENLFEEEDMTEVVTGNALSYKIRNYQRTHENNAAREQRLNADNSLFRRVNTIYTKTLNMVNKMGIFLTLFLLYRRRNQLKQNDLERNLFNYVLFMFALGSLAVLLISSGNRFIVLANMLFIFYFATIYNLNNIPLFDKCAKWLVVINFYAISFLFFNAPRLVEAVFWIAPPPITIINGVSFNPFNVFSQI